VRGIATSPIAALPRGSTVLNSGHHTRTPFPSTEFERTARLLTAGVTGSALPADAQGKFLETGIKVIDVMCPLVAGGTVAIAGDLGAGMLVVMEELVRRLGGGSDPLSMFVMMPPPSPEWPYSLEPVAEALRKDGFSEGTIGAVQTFFFRAEDGPWTAERIAALAPADVIIRLSRECARAGVYPTVDALVSRSRWLEAKAAHDDHATIAGRVRQALALLWETRDEPDSRNDRSLLGRALKIQNYFTQPLFCAEPWTGLSGVTVSAPEALRACQEILDGQHDDVPVQAFYFSGSIAEIRSNLGCTRPFGPVTL
jgi:F0F1-type ATP synthase beta subunit